jgi:hypothetical protein
MIGIGEQDAHAEFVVELARREAFDGGLRAYGHEHGGFDGSVGRVQEAGAGACVGALGLEFESNLTQFMILAGGKGGVKGLGRVRREIRGAGLVE